MTEEIWADILTMAPYQASNLGRVRNGATGKVLTARPRSQRGYPTVVLSLPDGRRDTYVHHAVLLAFVGPPKPGQIARHLDDDPNNNTPANLRWGTHSENARDRVRNGKDVNARKTACRYGHDYAGDNLVVNSAGTRECRACKAARAYAVATRVPYTPALRDQFYSRITAGRLDVG